MQRKTVLSLAMLVIAGLAITAAFAVNAHFVRATASGPNASGNLIVSFKEAGLGDNQLISYEARADATAVYACRNNGGNFPSDPKKQEVSGPVTASGTFSSGRNGTISQSLTIMPPPSTLNCPPGQREVIVSVTYTNVRIVDTTNNVTESIPGVFSRTFVTLP